MKIKSKIFLFIIFFVFLCLTTDVNALSYYRVTNTNGVSLKSGPENIYKTVEKIKYNDMVLVENSIKAGNQNCSKGWFFVKHENKTGYICSNYIDSSNITALIKKKNTAIKNGPSSTYKTYTRLNAYINVTMKNGKRTKVKKCHLGYYRININGKRRGLFKK